MEPRIDSDEYVLINALAYRLGAKPQRGDVVAFRHERSAPSVYLKRVIGLPGDRIEIARGTVYVNGAQLDEPYVRFRDARSAAPRDRPARSLLRSGRQPCQQRRLAFLGVRPGSRRRGARRSRRLAPRPHGSDPVTATIQWYPGHMAKAMRRLAEDLRIIDVVIEAVDARVPGAGANPALRTLGGAQTAAAGADRDDLAEPRRPPRGSSATAPPGESRWRFTRRTRGGAQQLQSRARLAAFATSNLSRDRRGHPERGQIDADQRASR